MLNLWQQRNEAVSAGTATITTKANDGSGVSATCEVVVTGNKGS